MESKQRSAGGLTPYSLFPTGMTRSEGLSDIDFPMAAPSIRLDCDPNRGMYGGQPRSIVALLFLASDLIVGFSQP
jgi:hypothetical protein